MEKCEPVVPWPSSKECLAAKLCPISCATVNQNVLESEETPLQYVEFSLTKCTFDEQLKTSGEK